MRMEPPPSLAPAAGTIPAATAAADPPELPPGVRAGSHGLRVGPPSAGSVTARAPNSGVAVRPNTTSPASVQRRTTVDVSGRGRSASGREPDAVGTPAMCWARSFTRNGTPANGPLSGPRARERAASSSRSRMALMPGSTASARATAASSRSAALTSPAATSAASPTASWLR